MKTTKKYMHLAGVVFRPEAERLEERLLGTGVQPSGEGGSVEPDSVVLDRHQ
jgi:hypothetical protein